MSPTDPSELFEISITDGPAAVLHRREFGDLDTSYPWDELDPSRYPPLLVERARIGWTENAFNEYCTAVAMGQLIQAMGQARVPIDLWSMACRFPSEELLHVELCARVAMRLGGGAPLRYDPASVEIPLDPSLSPLERANELIIRLCCVGEALSFPLLSGCMRSAAHPLTRSVLTTIVKDEALHGRLGFLYLEWIASELSAAERDRLGRVARSTLDEYAPLWTRLRSRVVDGVTSEGFSIDHVRELGWMDAESYTALAHRSVEESVTTPLAKFGILVPHE